MDNFVQGITLPRASVLHKGSLLYKSKRIMNNNKKEEKISYQLRVRGSGKSESNKDYY